MNYGTTEAFAKLSFNKTRMGRRPMRVGKLVGKEATRGLQNKNKRSGVLSKEASMNPVDEFLALTKTANTSGEALRTAGQVVGKAMGTAGKNTAEQVAEGTVKAFRKGPSYVRGIRSRPASSQPAPSKGPTRAQRAEAHWGADARQNAARTRRRVQAPAQASTQAPVQIPEVPKQAVPPQAQQPVSTPQTRAQRAESHWGEARQNAAKTPRQRAADEWATHNKKVQQEMQPAPQAQQPAPQAQQPTTQKQPVPQEQPAPQKQPVPQEQPAQGQPQPEPDGKGGFKMPWWVVPTAIGGAGLYGVNQLAQTGMRAAQQPMNYRPAGY